MARQGLGVDPGSTLGAELLAQGRSNVTYRVWQDSGEWVVRRPPFGHVMPTAHDMTREHAVISGVARAGFPVPRPLALCEDPDVIGAVFHVMEFVRGRTLTSAADTATMSDIEARSLSVEVVDVLTRLHAVDAGAVGLGELGRPTGFLPRQARRWREQWERSKTRDLPAAVTLVDRLDARLARLPDDLPWTIVHGDYRLDNTIVDPGMPRITAVVDWEMATLGDPLADLGLLLVYWTRPDDGALKQLGLIQGVTDASGFLDRQELVDTYVDITGRDVDHLDACIALSCFKLAVILESIRTRILSGAQVGAAAGQAEQMGEATDLLIRVGLDALDGDAIAALGS